MMEASAYGGFELAIGYCHLYGLGNFDKDEKKGYNIINKCIKTNKDDRLTQYLICLLYTSPSPRDLSTSRMPSSA